MNTPPTFDLSATGLCWPNIRLACQLCADAYVKPATIQSAISAELIVTEYPDCIAIAFRGSADAQDWIQDGKFVMVDYATLTNGSVAKVHQGFYEDYMSVRTKLASYLGLHTQAIERDKPFIITGHSLGAGQCVIAVLDLTKAGYTVQRVITFGQPRVGNDIFCNLYGSILGNRTDRIVNAGDLVAVVPPESFGYREEVPEILLPINGGQPIVDPDDWVHAECYAEAGWVRLKEESILKMPDHHIAEYQARVANLYEYWS